MNINKHEYCQKSNFLDSKLEITEGNSGFNKVSWSDIKLYMECPRCFFRFKILKRKRPGIDPDTFSIYNAVDRALKNDFDLYRKRRLPHPVMLSNNISATPMQHEKLYAWRGDGYRQDKGIFFKDEKNGLILQGCIDDVWLGVDERVYLVEYKVTSQPGNLFFRYSKWAQVYKQQLSYYRWLFKQNRFDVSNIGYFVCCVFNKNQPFFNNQLNSQTSLVTIECKDDWIEDILVEITECLNGDSEPIVISECEFCNF